MSYDWPSELSVLLAPAEPSRQNVGSSSGWEGCGRPEQGRNIYATNVRWWAMPDYVFWLRSEATSSANQLRSLVKVADRDQTGVTPFRVDHYFLKKTAAVTRMQELEMWEICWFINDRMICGTLLFHRCELRRWVKRRPRINFHTSFYCMHTEHTNVLQLEDLQVVGWRRSPFC
jgi:hypothetical protein